MLGKYLRRFTKLMSRAGYWRDLQEVVVFANRFQTLFNALSRSLLQLNAEFVPLFARYHQTWRITDDDHNNNTMVHVLTSNIYNTLHDNF